MHENRIMKPVGTNEIVLRSGEGETRENDRGDEFDLGMYGNMPIKPLCITNVC
jgi:hypothetical protein